MASSTHIMKGSFIGPKHMRLTWGMDRRWSQHVREANATSPKQIGTESTEASVRKLPEPYFFLFFVFRRTEQKGKRRRPNLLSKKRWTSTHWSIVEITVGALWKLYKGITLSKYGKNLTKISQFRFSERITRNVEFPGGNRMPPKLWS